MQKKTMYIVGIIVVLVAAGGAYVLMNNSSPTSKSSSPYSTTTPSTTTKSTASGDVVQTKTASNVGSYLADSSDNPLYTYGADTDGVSNCSGSCLYNWPVYAPTSTSSALPANVTVITRSDNTKQYAYKGMPLYTFTSDSAGKVTGDGVADFHVAKP